MEEVVELIIPFIALAILSVMIDKFTLFLEGVMKLIPGLPDSFEWPVAYIIVLAVGYVICWQGNYDLFAYLNINFRQPWQGWLMTALVISGGSAFVRSSFDVVDNIPASLSGLTATIKKIFSVK
ncbi:MAG: hypothetical protein H0Z40_01570 [Desulfotomaculum sp.]|nr:hypothetical protein [Desulfotomaculum sp.]